MNIIDIAIILLIVMSGIIGFKKGVLKEVVSFLGTLIVFVIAFYLTGIVAELFVRFLPVFDFGGLYVLNIVVYYIIAFVLIGAFLFALLNLILKATGLLQKLIDLTIILTIPSKILGFAFGLVKGYIVIFVMLMILAIPLRDIDMFRNSTVRSTIMNESPILTNAFSGISSSIEDIFTLLSTPREEDDNNALLNRDIGNILINNDVVSRELIADLNARRN